MIYTNDVQETYPRPPATKRRRWPWILGILVAFGLGGAIGTSGEPEVETVTETETVVEEVEVEPSDIEERRSELDEREEGLDEREGELEAREGEVDEREEELGELEASLEEEPEENEAESDSGTTIPGNGTFLVGEDIAPGTYRTDGSGNFCYWARLSGLSGEFQDIITNGVPEGSAYVTISASDVAFETSSCGQWIMQ